MPALMPETTADDIQLEGMDNPDFAARLQAEMAALDAEDAQPAAPAEPRASAADVEPLAAAATAPDPAKTPSNESTGEAAPAAPAKPEEKAEAPKAETTPPDNRSKYAKEVERRERSWKALNEQKAAHDAMFAKFKAEQEAFAREQAEWHDRQAKASAPSYNAEQCEEAAKVHEQQGEFKLAELLRAEAKRLRENPPAHMAPRGPQPLSEDAKASLGKVRTDFPEFTRPDTQEHMAFKQLAQERPDLLAVKDGPYLVAQHIKLKLKADADAQAASRVPSLEKELAEAKAKLKEQERLLAISGGEGPAALPAGRSFDDLSPDEMERELARTLGRG